MLGLARTDLILLMIVAALTAAAPILLNLWPESRRWRSSTPAIPT